jgi:hypothetical protein
MPAPLPETHILAVLARLGLLLAVLALVAAALIQPPRVFYSYHAQHFAAFYVLAVMAALSFKRRTVIGVGMALSAFALAFEMARSLSPLRAHTTYLDWFADAAGIVAALGPMLAQKIRAAFTPPDAPENAPPP